MKTDVASPPRVALVVPYYNEEQIAIESVTTLVGKLLEWKESHLIAENSFCCVVDDGSTDATWHRLTTIDTEVPIVGLKLAFNAGHQNALFAGMAHVADHVDCCITLDADLQQDTNAIPEMLMHYPAVDVVYGIRKDRAVDSWFKRITGNLFYWISKRMGVVSIKNHPDFRLLSRRALSIIKEYNESHLYLRGLIPNLKLPSAKVYFARQQRIGGTSKYTLSQMLRLAFNGIFSFSIMPLRIISIIGGIFIAGAICYTSLVIWRYFSGATVSGWSSMIISLYLVGGIIMFSLGIIGEYIGKIFIESKKRPRYVIERIVSSNPDSQDTSVAN